MAEAMRCTSGKESAPPFVIAAERPDEQEILLEFLAWLEQTKGLVLCQEFKPKYDWYTRVFTDKKGLVGDFLGKKRAVTGNVCKGESEIAVLHLPEQGQR